VRSWADAAREHARAILQAVLAEASPQKLLRAFRREADALVLPDGSRVRLSGRAVRCAAVGKAAGGLAAHAQPWGPFAEAMVAGPYEADVPGFEDFVGAHPEPDAGSVRAGERLLALARATRPDDLLILLLSGGASALCEAPAVPLEDLARVTRALLRSDAPIRDINVVRKHLSLLKGGQLARACQGEILVVAISDVEPGDVASLGSGPAAPDPSTFADALDVLASRGLLDAAPASVRARLEAGTRGEVAETPKPGDPAFSRVRTVALSDNERALQAGARVAAQLGYEVATREGGLFGEARERGREIAQEARRLARAGGGKPFALLVGGECVVRVEGRGRGGRNQELALAAMPGLSAHDALLAAFATDGQDGPTDAAGAIVDGSSLARAQRLGLDVEAHLHENDSYAVFDALDDLIRSGPTGTNVRDVAVLLVRR